MSSKKLILLNPQGLRTPGRLSALLFEAKRDQVAILIINEHNLTFANKSRAETEAKRKGFIPCIGYAHDRGGSAIFVDASAHGLDVHTPIPHASHLDGRITIADIPHPTEGQKPFRVAAMYVPASPRDS